MKSDNTTPNVPTLRLSHFSGSWDNFKLSDVCFYRKEVARMPKTNYVSTENIRQNYLGITRFESDEIICGNKFYKGDILLSNIRPYLKKVWLAEFDGICNADVLILAPHTNIQSDFLYYLVANENFVTYVMSSVKGSKMPRGDKSFIMDYPVSVPDLAEQQNISCFITNLDSRIQLQSKIIEDLKVLKKELCSKLLAECSEYKCLGEVCTISTGKLDANACDVNGLYPFFTCGKETLRINTYAFDGDAILIAGNGDIGHTKYYNGKFNAYQRTYVLMNFSGEAEFYQMGIDCVLPQKVIEETQGGAMPYIKLSTLTTLQIPYTTPALQKDIVKRYKTICEKVDSETNLLCLYNKQKTYLLSKLFI